MALGASRKKTAHRRWFKAVFHTLIFLFLCSVSANAGYAAEDDHFIFQMIESNNLNMTRSLIKSGFDINKLYNYRAGYMTPLQLAVGLVKPDIVKLLLDSNANITVEGSNAFSPIFFVVSANVVDDINSRAFNYEDAMKVLDLLLEYGADVNIKTETGHIPLIMAISGANYERSLIVTKKLIEYGANVNPKLENNMEPIFWAILQDPSFHHDDRSEMVRLLIEAGADLTEARLEGRTPLEIATEIGSIEAAELLLYNIYK